MPGAHDAANAALHDGVRPAKLVGIAAAVVVLISSMVWIGSGQPGSDTAGIVTVPGAGVNKPALQPLSPEARPAPPLISDTRVRAPQPNPQPDRRLNRTEFQETFGVETVRDGYAVGADVAPGIAKVGILPGDVVLRVNGKPLGEPVSDQAVFASAAAEGFASFEVRRAGRIITLQYPPQ
jgi:S1-C subfamily serine protease